MNLYEIKQELTNAVNECVDMETGEILDSDRLNNLNMALNDKRENIGLYIKNLTCDSKAIDEEIKNLTARKKRINNKIDWLKSYLSNDLQGNKFETAKVVINFRKSEQLEVISTEHIPAEYLITQNPKIDKTGLKQLIKQGTAIDGVQIITKQNIQIK